MDARNDLVLNNRQEIPRLGFGLWQVPTEIAADRTSIAIQQGYRLIDTAEAYFNEAEVGAAIQQSGIPRDEVYVTTKVWNDHHGYDSTLRAFDDSLERLGLDQVDLYLMHWPSQRRDLFVETWRAMIKIRASGQARSIGVSNFAIPHLQRILDETGIMPAVNQVELHPYFQQVELRQFHKALGIATQSWSPLGVWRNPYPPLVDPAILAIAEKHGRTPAQIILRWHLQSDLLVISKSVQPCRIIDNVKIFDFQLDANDMVAIEMLDRRNGRLGPEPETATF